MTSFIKTKKDIFIKNNFSLLGDPTRIEELPESFQEVMKEYSMAYYESFQAAPSLSFPFPFFFFFACSLPILFHSFPPFPYSVIDSFFFFFFEGWNENGRTNNENRGKLLYF